MSLLLSEIPFLETAMHLSTFSLNNTGWKSLQINLHCSTSLLWEAIQCFMVNLSYLSHILIYAYLSIQQQSLRLLCFFFFAMICKTAVEMLYLEDVIVMEQVKPSLAVLLLHTAGTIWIQIAPLPIQFC